MAAINGGALPLHGSFLQSGCTMRSQTSAHSRTCRARVASASHEEVRLVVNSGDRRAEDDEKEETDVSTVPRGEEEELWVFWSTFGSAWSGDVLWADGRDIMLIVEFSRQLKLLARQ